VNRRRLYYYLAALGVLVLVSFLSCLPRWGRASRAQERGIAEYKAGRFKEAEESLKAALAADPSLHKPHLYLGRIYGRRGIGAAKMAEQEYSVYLDTAKRDARAWHELGRLLAANPDRSPKDAEEKFHRAIRLTKNKTFKATVHHELSGILARQGNLKGAIAESEKAIKLSPKNVGFHRSLGAYYEKGGDLEEAETALLRVIELKDDPATWHRLGGIRLRLGHREAAEEGFGEALMLYTKETSVSPDDADMWYNIGTCHKQLGQVREALDAYLKAYEIARNTDNARIIRSASMMITICNSDLQRTTPRGELEETPEPE